jgi:hypothetical protein
MFGSSDNNRSEGQGGCREVLSTKAVRSQGTTVGTRTGSEAAMRAMSVRENAKSNCHRKTHRVEPDGAGRKFMHLTRGGLRRESAAEVSRGHSSEDARVTAGRAKGRRNRTARSTQRLRSPWRAVLRNRRGVATTAASPPGAKRTPGWTPRSAPRAGGQPPAGRSRGGIR